MKKFISGLLVGILLCISSTVFAETVIVNFIGQKIQGQFPVTIDGELLENPAIVVNGTSFLPVRKFSEAAGYNVYFDAEGDIRLERDLSKSPMIHGMDPVAKAEEEQMKANAEKKNQIETAKTKIKIEIDIAKSQLQRAEYRLNELIQMLNDFKPNPNIPETESAGAKAKLETRIEEEKNNINALNEKIKTLEAELEALN
ncbi:hypothetical protein [Paenibacillus thermotolerans]|uniref:hypothetical protein n=1 Tax=Paenibacillus thermotolerans TaxID=3027807 RepID=UPI00236890AF|nr:MULTISPECIES: hypothetical protein [unclassified Paenibacillus]